MVEKISREYIVSQTIDLMNVDIGNMTNKKAIKEMIKARFNRSNPNMYPMFDALFYSIITAVCDQMESQGIRQPDAANFLSSFRTIQGINVNIGNLHIENFTPSKEFEELITDNVINYMKNEYILKARSEVLEVVEKEELDQEFEKYENFAEGEENDTDEGTDEQVREEPQGNDEESRDD